MATVQLDREQREAIRSEIRVAASRSKDIRQCLEPGGTTDRASVIRKIAELVRWVAMLDAIGWQEPPDAPNESVGHGRCGAGDVGAWSAAELERAFDEFYVTDGDLDALAAAADRSARVIARPRSWQ